MLASAEPVITHCEVEIEETRATVVPVAAAAAFAGEIKQAAGVSESVAEKLIVQVVVVAEPMVMSPA